MSENKHEAGNAQVKQDLQFVIEGKTHETFDQYITGEKLKALAAIPLETEIFLSVSEPFEDELIENEKKVNLARPTIEYFYVKKKLKLTILDKTYTWYKQFISRSELIKLGGLDASSVIYLAIKRPWQDTLVSDTVIIDLAREGVEHFYVEGCDTGNLVSIAINTRPYQLKRGKYSVEQLKKLDNIPLAHELEEIINGELTPLNDDAIVLVKGCEQFVSHVRDGSSS